MPGVRPSIQNVGGTRALSPQILTVHGSDSRDTASMVDGFITQVDADAGEANIVVVEVMHVYGLESVVRAADGPQPTGVVRGYNWSGAPGQRVD